MSEYNKAEFGNDEFSSQDAFYALLDKYSKGIEPLSNWTSVDLVALVDAVDVELQNRAPEDGTYDSSPPDSEEEDEDDEGYGYN